MWPGRVAIPAAVAVLALAALAAAGGESDSGKCADTKATVVAATPRLMLLETTDALGTTLTACSLQSGRSVVLRRPRSTGPAVRIGLVSASGPATAWEELSQAGLNTRYAVVGATIDLARMSVHRLFRAPSGNRCPSATNCGPNPYGPLTRLVSVQSGRAGWIARTETAPFSFVVRAGRRGTAHTLDRGESIRPMSIAVADGTFYWLHGATPRASTG